jgi:hypothetical protein
MKVDRSINFISDLAGEDWRTIYAKYKLFRNSQYSINPNSGIVFCPYIPNVFDISSMYPHIIEVKEDETKMKRRSDVEHISDIRQDTDLTYTNGAFSPIAMPLVRRQFPALFANVLVGVAPINKDWKTQKKKVNNWKLNPKKQKYIHR